MRRRQPNIEVQNESETDNTPPGLLLHAFLAHRKFIYVCDLCVLYNVYCICSQKRAVPFQLHFHQHRPERSNRHLLVVKLNIFPMENLISAQIRNLCTLYNVFIHIIYMVLLLLCG